MNSLETVFEWLLTASLRASILAVAILGIQFVLRDRLPAAWRYALWLPMLAVLVLPVLPETPFGLPAQKASQPASAELSSLPVAVGFIAAEMLPESPATQPNLPAKRNYLAFVWLTGVCGMLAAGAIGHFRSLRRIQQSASAPDQELLAAMEDAAKIAGLRNAPQTLISPDVSSPAVTGFARPVLLLPAGFPGGFSATEARLILLHEFTHLKRFDLPINWLLCVLQALHWFNPLLWFAFARVRADREAACDARVLSINTADRRSEYGGALLKMQCMAPSRFLSLGFVGIFERNSEIKSRIRGISNYRPARFGSKVAGGALLILLTIFGVTQGQQSDGSSNGQEKRVEAPVEATEAGKVQDRIQKQLDSLIIPSINFNKATVEDAIQFLRQRAQQLDTSEPDPAKRGVNIVLQIPDTMAGEVPKITLQLQNIPLSEVLQLICDAANLSYTVSNYAVIISPKSAQELLGKTYGSLDELDKEHKPTPAQELFQQKIKSLIIPSINFNNATLEEAIQFLRLRAQALDTSEPDPAKRGVNLVLQIPDAIAGEVPKITLQLQNIPLSEVLQLICDAANLSYTVSNYAVIIFPDLPHFQREKGGKAE